MCGSVSVCGGGVHMHVSVCVSVCLSVRKVNSATLCPMLVKAFSR